MRKTILLAALVLAVSSASAGRCTTRDPWTGPDKVKHFGAGAAIGLTGALVFESPKVGFWAGAAAGAGVELLSAITGRGKCTAQDFLVTALGAGIGAGTSILILPKRDGVQVVFAKTL
ncbi:MAG: hypothetical protein EOP39_04655 [Rubrivivax sp.]|nr:MAG: hypothetical protein EOP39_04655 [Rubrivivax sp.]